MKLLEKIVVLVFANISAFAYLVRTIFLEIIEWIKFVIKSPFVASGAVEIIDKNREEIKARVMKEPSVINAFGVVEGRSRSDVMEGDYVSVNETGWWVPATQRELDLYFNFGIRSSRLGIYLGKGRIQQI